MVTECVNAHARVPSDVLNWAYAMSKPLGVVADVPAKNTKRVQFTSADELHGEAVQRGGASSEWESAPTLRAGPPIRQSMPQKGGRQRQKPASQLPRRLQPPKHCVAASYVQHR